MLHFLVWFSLRMVMGFILLGALVSRSWGWSEYASPELYVVYYQLVDRQIQYSTVGADGRNEGARLTWDGAPLARLDCSPDGRVFAFLTDSGHLYVMTSAGILYDSAEDRLYNTVNVANDGTVALYDPAAGWLVVNEHGITLSAPDHKKSQFDRIDISPQGLVLWNRNFEDIQVLSLASGSVVSSVARGYLGEWLASGQMFAFSDSVVDADGISRGGGQFVMDVATQATVRIGSWTRSQPLSPDGTKVAAAYASAGSKQMQQIVIYNLFGDNHRQQLTHDPDIASLPMCFLTFRPEMDAS